MPLGSRHLLLPCLGMLKKEDDRQPLLPFAACFADPAGVSRRGGGAGLRPRCLASQPRGPPSGEASHPARHLISGFARRGPPQAAGVSVFEERRRELVLGPL